jgi:putative Holliday junction resolvase
MRLLGLDLGEKRIGVALSDAQGIVTRPVEVIFRRSKREDFEAIDRLVRKWDVERVVIGLPLTSENEIGPQARRVKRYARELGRALSVPIDFVDERYSTVDALDVLRTAGHSRKKQRERVDAVAAAILLESYLDTIRRQGEQEATVSDESHGDGLAT